VAYLEGSTLRVVDGRGNPATDRRLRRGAAAVAPAWLPRSDRFLTYARADGTLETLDVATGRGSWRTNAPIASVRSLAWSGDGRRLVALSPRSVAVLDASGHVLRTIALPGVGRELALHPSGRRAAAVVRSGNQTSVVELPLDGDASRRLFQGDVDGIAWSADGRRLLVGWRGAGEWLLIGPGERIRALHGVTAELGARGGFPRVAGWCCSR
jgi:WD40 repeat protein